MTEAEKSAILLRVNKEKQIAALKNAGIELDIETATGTDIANAMKWAGGVRSSIPRHLSRHTPLAHPYVAFSLLSVTRFPTNCWQSGLLPSRKTDDVSGCGCL